MYYLLQSKLVYIVEIYSGTLLLGILHAAKILGWSGVEPLARPRLVGATHGGGGAALRRPAEDATEPSRH